MVSRGDCSRWAAHLHGANNPPSHHFFCVATAGYVALRFLHLRNTSAIVVNAYFLDQDEPDELLRLKEPSAIPMRFCIDGSVKLVAVSVGGEGGGFGDRAIIECESRRPEYEEFLVDDVEAMSCA